jgi:hypothetical protein
MAALLRKPADERFLQETASLHRPEINAPMLRLIRVSAFLTTLSLIFPYSPNIRFPGDRIGISDERTLTTQPTPTPISSDQEKHDSWLEAITSERPASPLLKRDTGSLMDKENP